MKFLEKNGLIYYNEGGNLAHPEDKIEWKIAGRKNHPLTKRFMQLLKGETTDENTCVCRQC